MSNLRMTCSDYVKRAREVHGRKYNYEGARYTGIVNSIKVTCALHGPFDVSASNHLRGRGCPECAKTTRWDSRGRIDTEAFVVKAKSVHGNQYRYTKTNYTRSVQSIVITCPKHGDFKRQANAHLTGAGCPECTESYRGANLRSKTKVFIAKARAVHGKLYKYANAAYETAHTKLSITCLKHGDFTQTPDNHLHGHGCPDCFNMSNPDYFHKNLPNFFRTKQIMLNDGRKVNVQGYEPFAIDYLSHKLNVRRIKFGSEVPCIKYRYDGKNRTYHPDMLYGNTLVEVKSLYIWRMQLEQNKQKLRAALSNGYNIRLLVFDKDGVLLKDIKRQSMI